MFTSVLENQVQVFVEFLTINTIGEIDISSEVVELSGVSEVDCAGLQWLLCAHKSGLKLILPNSDSVKNHAKKIGIKWEDLGNE